MEHFAIRVNEALKNLGVDALPLHEVDGRWETVVNGFTLALTRHGFATVALARYVGTRRIVRLPVRNTVSVEELEQLLQSVLY